MKMCNDVLIHGVGAMKGGEHIPVEGLFAEPEE